MRTERIDDLVDILGEEFAKVENTFVIRNNQQLLKYLENPEQWKQKQLKSRESFRRELVADAKRTIASLNAKTEKVYLLSYQEIDKDHIKIVGNEIVATDFPEDARKSIREMQKFNAEQVLKLANKTLTTYTKQVRLIDQISSPETLYETVLKQMPKGIENGIKVSYSDGKVYSWKAYMEMNIRTTVHQEIGNQQIKAGARAGLVFYMCDSFGDCAPDHAAYQGKLYYNEEAARSEEEQAYIDSHGILSMQQVRDNDPWLTTRPNCRHNFHAIPSEDVLGKSSDDILKDEGLVHGKYNSENYKLTQQQRYNERQIRKYKLREEDAKKLSKMTSLKDFKVGQAHSKVQQWQAKQRELIAKHDEVLKRQYNRENAKIIVNDLGVRYDYKVVDGELVKKK